MSEVPTDEWTIVVPVKRLSAAKSRMTTAGVRDVDALALAFFQDTLASAIGLGGSERVIVATCDLTVGRWARDAGCRVFDDRGRPGINAAVRAAAVDIPGNLAVLVSDLPCSTAGSLAWWLDVASGYPTAFVADAAGTGTTMWTQLAGQPTDPRFGHGSRAAHGRSGAVDMVATVSPDATVVHANERERLRRDVDTPQDLLDAMRIGVGPFTAVAVATMDPA